MHQEYYGCSGGCRNCPRMRQCMQAAVPAMVVAEAPAQPADEPELNEFLAENPDQGILRIQAFRGNQAIPVENVHVVISRPMDGGTHIFFEGDTDCSGLIDPIPLPAPNREQSLHPGALHPFASYEMRAEHPQFLPQSTTVDLYQDIKTVQPVQQQLRTE